MLTPLQQRIAEIVSEAIVGTDIALAGGRALIASGLVDRGTRDLDFFGSSSEVLVERLPVITTALRGEGFDVEVRRSTETFARIVVRGLGYESEVDFGLDSRLFPIRQGEFAPILSSKEVAVDKVLAIFGRAEARDLVDLAAIEQYFSMRDLFDLAREKDQGIDLSVFADTARRARHLHRAEFVVEDESYAALMDTVDLWRELALNIDRERGHGHGMER